MKQTNSAEQLLSDPLASTTRHTRKRLLALCVLAIVIEKTGLLPTQIEGLGIVFEANHRSAMITILLFSVVYFFASFLLYALSDYSKWQLQLRKFRLPEQAVENRARIFDVENGESGNTAKELENNPFRQAAAKVNLDKLLQDRIRSHLWPYWQGAPILGFLRALLDFLLPIVLAIYSVYLLGKLIYAI